PICQGLFSRWAQAVKPWAREPLAGGVRGSFLLAGAGRGWSAALGCACRIHLEGGRRGVSARGRERLLDRVEPGSASTGAQARLLGGGPCYGSGPSCRR